MDLVTRLAEQALALRLPFREGGRGKRHSYELTFRAGVEAVRTAYEALPELRAAALAGRPPAAEELAALRIMAAGTLLKTLERRQESNRFRDVINPGRGDLGAKVREFVDALVDEVFQGRAHGSLARFLALEDVLANGVYYHTDRVLDGHWQRYRQERQERVAVEGGVNSEKEA